MDSSSIFKVPTTISQDIALIMNYVDPPTPGPGPESHETCNKQSTSVVKTEEEEEEDINSSGHESEDEEVKNVLFAGLQEKEKNKENKDSETQTSETNVTVVVVANRESNLQDSDGSSSHSNSDSDADTDSDLDGETGKVTRDEDVDTKQFVRPRNPNTRPELDLDEDGPPIPDDYMPTAHEIPLTSVPIPPLPDPTTLPNDPLELVGEISTILTDTVIVRGGGGSPGGHSTAMEKRHSILDEGSLLLLDDLTPLGYVFETFGPTHLPHYIVRIARRSAKAKAKALVKEEVRTEMEEIEDEARDKGEAEVSSADALLDKIALSRPVYHLRSTSKFVFTEALHGLKGSDASNIHDEELLEHEQEFSDDEAEAAFKRSKRKGSRAPSVSRSHRQRSESVSYPEHNHHYTDDAGSLYGDSPYDTEEYSNSSFGMAENRGLYDNVAQQYHYQQQQYHQTGITPSTSASSSPLHQNPEIQRALLNARMSRRRKSTNASHPGYPDNTNAWPHPQQPQTLSSSSRSFSYEEYDPRMPRAPSPTSLAIAQATGQWSNGTPLVYDTTYSTATGMNMTSIPFAAPVLNGYHPYSSAGVGYGGMGPVSGAIPAMNSPFVRSPPLPPPPPYQALPTTASVVPASSFEQDDSNIRMN